MSERHHLSTHLPTLLVTGGTCPVGECFLQEITAAGRYRVRCLVRHTSDTRFLERFPLEFIQCDLDRDPLILDWFRGVEVVVHIAGIRRSLSIMEAMEGAGVTAGLFVNTAAVHSRFPVAGEIYRELEERMARRCRKTGIRFAAIRPTMIYGDGRNRNVSRLVDYLSRHTLVPLFGSGDPLVQPVFYRDVAGALVSLLEHPAGWGRCYDTGGKKALSYRSFVEHIAQRLGKKIRFVRVPVGAAIGLARLGKRLGGRFPWTEEQVLRATEDRVADNSAASKCFGYDPIDFNAGLTYEIEALRSRGMLC